MLKQSYLRYPGNKYNLLPYIRKYLAPGKRLIEPFVGSGSIFLNTDYDEYICSDINVNIIHTHQIVADTPLFEYYFRGFFEEDTLNPEFYYKVREYYNQCYNSLEKAICFIYLNRYGFNGLVRYNSSGGYNVPFGHQKRVPSPPIQQVREFRQKCGNALYKFVQSDFRDVLENAKVGDVIYADPPYLPLSVTSNFTQYSGNIFTEDDHKDLANIAYELSQNGIPVLISSSASNKAFEIYKEYSWSEQVDYRHNIKLYGKNEVTECLFLYE